MRHAVSRSNQKKKVVRVQLLRTTITRQYVETKTVLADGGSQTFDLPEAWPAGRQGRLLEAHPPRGWPRLWTKRKRKREQGIEMFVLAYQYFCSSIPLNKERPSRRTSS